MLTGLKGVKYGLQPGAKAKAPLHKPALKAFTEDDDDDEAPTTGSSIGRDIARQAAKKASNKKVSWLQLYLAGLQASDCPCPQLLLQHYPSADASSKGCRT